MAISALYFALVLIPRRMLARGLGFPHRRLVILYYHGVRDGERASFRNQMDALSRAGLPVPLSEVPPRAACDFLVGLTFDDGFANLVRNVFPELSDRKIPATIFIPSGNLGKPPSWHLETGCADRTERILSPEELRFMDHTLFTVGSHTVSHEDLTRMPEERILEEFTRSRKDLEHLTGAPVVLLSFPHGRHSERIAEMARRAGYRMAFTIDPETICPDRAGFLAGRTRVDPSDWRVEFWLKIRGGYSWMGTYQKLKRGIAGSRDIRSGSWRCRGK